MPYNLLQHPCDILILLAVIFLFFYGFQFRVLAGEVRRTVLVESVQTG